MWPNTYLFSSAYRIKVEYVDGGRSNCRNSAKVKGKMTFAMLNQTFRQILKLKEAYIGCNTKSKHRANATYQLAIDYSTWFLNIALLKIKKLVIGSIGSWNSAIPLYTDLSLEPAYLNFRSNYRLDMCLHIIK
ncbi:hypothetical protein BX070DRAFT_234673 [Coemansia spiralis]|nr:hypothetical protein BX070DRAFT_234673 [Coemansia spiralis]